MDLGIQGKTAIVCAASKGLGKACATSLAKNGVNLVINSRTAADLEATAAEIRAATGVKVLTRTVVAPSVILSVGVLEAEATNIPKRLPGDAVSAAEIVAVALMFV